jgi:integrase
MSVRVVPWKPGTMPVRWRVDIRFTKPSGEKFRDQVVHAAPTKGMAKRWGEAREARLRDGSLVVRAPEVEAKTIPTWDEFWPRYLEHIIGDGESDSGVAMKSSANRVWLSPAFGSLALDQITDERVSALRSKIRKTPGRKQGSAISPMWTNNILSALNTALKLAVKWHVLDAMPCSIEIRVVRSSRPDFYDFEDYARLCEAASKVGSREHVLVRLGGDAGLRRGEMMALRWVDVDFRRKQIRVEQAAWVRSRKQVEAEGGERFAIKLPKGGRGRVVPMTDALAAALQAHRHLRGPYVLCRDDGAMVHGYMFREWLEAAQRRAGMLVLGALHKLRHTFCSHLAMRGAPVKAIQELAGHTDLSTTLRYMHLAPSALDQAIALLNGGVTAGVTVPGGSTI